MNLFEQILAIQECHSAHGEEIDDEDVQSYKVFNTEWRFDAQLNVPNKSL